jgi:Ca2+-binding RTX toxin-like protein
VTLNGGANNDTINGSGFGDIIDGQAGDDTISAGSGADVITAVPMEGLDTVNGQAGTDRLTITNTTVGNVNGTSSGSGTVITDAFDKIYNTTEQIELFGTLFEDGFNCQNAIGVSCLAQGGASNDQFVGGPGNDNFQGESHVTGDSFTILGDFGTLTVSGTVVTGQGTDTLGGIENFNAVASSAAVDNSWNASGSTFNRVMLAGGGGNDTLVGSQGIDTLAGEDGDDTLTGLGANDGLNGGGGADRLSESGFSNASFATPNSMNTSSGTDSVTFIELVTLAAGGASQVSYNTANFPGNATLVGSAGNDVLTGTASNDVLQGNGGTDAVDGGGGTGDQLTEFLPAGTLTLSNGQLGGTLGNSALSGVELFSLNPTGPQGTGPLSADAQAFSGAVTLNGSNGNDTLTGGTASDSLNGGDGSDTVAQKAGGDQTLTLGLLSGQGSDSLTSIEAAILTGDGGANRLDATAFTGAVSLFGLAGSDTLLGGAGGDVLNGGDDADSLIGAGGVDGYDAGNGDDTVNSADALAEPFVVCGAGLDTSIVDAVDTVNADCERLTGSAAFDMKAPTMTIRRARVGRRGVFSYRATCPADEISCRATWALTTNANAAARTRLARGSFSVAGGKTKTVKRKLMRRGFALLRKRKRLRATLTVRVRDAAGNRRTVRRKLILRAPRRR